MLGLFWHYVLAQAGRSICEYLYMSLIDIIYYEFLYKSLIDQMYYLNVNCDSCIITYK